MLNVPLPGNVYLMDRPRHLERYDPDAGESRH